MRFRLCVLGSLALGMAICLMVHFAFIWKYGKFYIYEPNPLILVMETVMMAAIIIYALYCVISSLKNPADPYPESVAALRHGSSVPGQSLSPGAGMAHNQQAR